MTLQIASFDAEELAEAYGTPLYVIDARILIQNVRKFQAAFQAHWAGPVRILPAIKAGTAIALLKRLRTETDGCDLFSEGEYEAALRAGFSPGSMSLNGNGKLASVGFIDRLVRDGVRITVDDIGELDAIENAAAKAGVVASLRLRMRPDLGDYWAATDFLTEGVPTYIASQAYKSGMPTADLLRAGKRVIASPHLNLTGLHTHFGRHKATTAYWRAAGRATAREIILCLEAWPGWVPREIDVGGGFAGPGDGIAHQGSFGFAAEVFALQGLRLLPTKIRCAVTAALFRASRRQIAENRASAPPPSFDDYAGAMIGELVHVLGGRLDLRQVALEVEPGRGIFADAGSHLARVLGVKRQMRPLPWTWVITDTSTAFLSDANTEKCRFTVRVDPAHPGTGTEIVDLTGVSCDADRIVGDARVACGISPGDLIVFENTGAYNEQAATNFNSLPRPASILIDDNGPQLIRRRETIDDVLSRDVVDAKGDHR
ncbi:diaminopimelate decarboxylase family protein [Acetobacter oeni]|uniref:Diaminopimelate decarboxylase n=1 Tax=Acetobacter oeni TaxID=304077 RepID=A0A511XQY4_9PROT|nr:alanine racemase [Acetobacter oeni]MBB3883735.1 diaminopimelate decarboxylase [Acetobacter oeni]NHO20852.1 hypothetical protein [Acetobacter oeni]GBR10235.1 diaminopimelate decarboxylase [Acetobacter oeni LMG 21952]GEN65370.1 diaminopimelate decarboxylase [Acetobacter oeni]